MLNNHYPFNLIRDIHGDEKHETKNSETAYIKGLFEQINTLGEREQAVIALRYEQGLTLKQCGEKLGVSPERIRQNLMTALRLLRYPSRAVHRRAVSEKDWRDCQNENAHLRQENDSLKSILHGVIDGSIKPEDIVHNHGGIIKTKKMTREELLHTPIEQLEITTRSYNALIRSGFITLGSIANTTERDLRKIRNLGESSLNEIKQTLHRYGLSLKGDEFL